MTSEYTKGIGRYTGMAIAHDDTMFMIAGAKANFTTSLNSIWTSYASSPDSTKPTDYVELMSPASAGTGVLTNSEVTLHFSEAITYKSSTTNIRLTDAL